MKPLKNTTIGLVLPSTPGYSETFFRSKIAGLQKNGAEVILFVANSKKTHQNLVSKVFYAPKLNGFKLAILYTSVGVLLQAFLFNYKISVKFLTVEKQDGTSFTDRIKMLIANHFILQQKVDWLHFGFGTMALNRENVAQAIGAKMAVSFRGFDIGIYPLKHPNCYQKLFRKVEKIHVISDDIAKLIFKQGLQPSNLITKITPAIDTTFFESHRSITNSFPQFVTIGRLHWKKGLEYTLEALFILKNQGIHFHYTIVGDGPELERLIFATHQLGLENNVTFTGKLTPDEVKLQLEKAEMYIQYSIQEGFCNAVLEAQAMGLLCVVSDAEGLSENVLNEKTGWVVPKRNPKLLAQKIQEILQLSSAQKNVITTNAIARVKTAFTIEKQTQAFLDFYKS